MIKNLINHFNSLSIRTRFIVTFLIIVFIPLCAVGVILYLEVEVFLKNPEIANNLKESGIKIAKDTRNWLLILGGFVTIVSMILALVASHYFSSQIKRIFHLLEAYSEDKFDVRETVTTNDEIGNILNNLHFMAEHIQEKQNNISKVQAKISDLYYNAPNMYCTLDLNGTILDVNKTFEITMGNEKDKFIKRSFFDLISSDSRHIFYGSFKEFLLHSDPHKGVEFKMNRLNHSPIYVNMSWNFFTEDTDHDFKTQAKLNNKTVYGVRVIIKDITLGKESEFRKTVLFDTMSVLPRMLSSFIGVEELIVFILEELKRVVYYDLACILLLSDENTHNYRISALCGLENNNSDLMGKLYSLENEQVKTIIDTQESQKFNKLFIPEAFPNVENQLKQSCYILPLMFINEIIGIMVLDNLRESDYTQEELILIEAFGGLISGATQNIIFREEVQAESIEVKSTMNDLKSKDTLLQKELDMAVSVQKGILPKESGDWNGIKVLNHYEAMGKVGGDFFDFFLLPQGKLAIFIADVSGHGIPAALVTTMAKIAFTSSAQRFYSPRRILVEVNNEMCQNIRTDDYLSVFFITIDQNYRVTYANAGHQVALLYRKRENQVIRLDTPGYFVGMMPEMGESYEESVIQLEYGDRIMLYTDGIVETINKKREQFGNDRLEALFKDFANLTVEELQSKIISEIDDFSQGLSRKDDLSLIIIELDENYEQVIKYLSDGKLQFQNGHYKESLKYFNNALEIDPDNFDTILLIAETYFRTLQFDECIKYFEQYVETKKNQPLVFYHLALAYFKIGKYDESIKSNLKAIEIDKNFSKSLYLLGLTYKKLNMYDDARKYFIELLRIDSNDIKAKKEIKFLDAITS